MSTAEDYETDRDRLWGSVVTTLTAAARLDHPERGTIDFADFLTSALRATAANLGDPHALTAGRPGSWESAHLNELLDSALGLDPSMFELAEYRTEPITVPLNVAALVEVEDHKPGTPQSFDDAVDDAEDDDDVQAEITHQYETAYRAYAQLFATAVEDEAKKHHTLPGLVAVTTDASITRTSEDPGVENPIEGESDPLVWHLWSTARDAVGLPAIPERN